MFEQKFIDDKRHSLIQINSIITDTVITVVTLRNNAYYIREENILIVVLV